MKYLYTALILVFLSQEGAVAQSKGGFFGKIKDTFSTEIKIGNYTFKDGSVYTGEMKGRKPNRFQEWQCLRRRIRKREKRGLRHLYLPGRREI